MRLNARGPYALVGVLFAAIALVGMVAFGWEFGGDTEPIALALALVAVVLAVGRHLTS
jgi:hypothetical protein